MEELVSVIIPNYNHANLLSLCVESVMNQTYPNIEVIVVDDCSSDNSVEVLRTLKDKYDNFLYCIQKKNMGVSEARNTGLRLAHGNYVTMLDSDDIYVNRDKIANEYKLAKEHDCIGYSKIVRIDQNGKRCDKQFLSRTEYAEGDILKDILLFKYMNTIPRDFVIKRDVAFQAGLYKPGMNLYEDLDFLIRILKYNEVRCTFEEGTGYRQGINGLSSRPIVEKNRIRWNICWRYRKLFQGIERFNITIRLIILRVKLELKNLIKAVLRHEYANKAYFKK